MKPLSLSSANGLPFDENYWSLLYGEKYTIDGIYNADRHIAYIRSLLDLMNVYVSTLGDFGFGQATILQEACRVFQPSRAFAVDPSQQMVARLKKQEWCKSFSLQIYYSTIEEFSAESWQKEPADLCFCNSVLQYLFADSIEPAFAKMSRMCRFLYFSVPTRRDYRRMKQRLEFTDPYAHSRSKSFYQKSFRPHFTMVSYNLLESKYLPRSRYAFNDELFRN